MTDKKESPAKGADRLSAVGTEKRPFATIDLKATEIESTGKEAAEQRQSFQRTAAEKIVAASQASTSAAADAAAAMAAASTPLGKVGPAAGSKFGEAARETKNSDSAVSRTAQAPLPRQGGSFGRFVSQMLAGIAGGLLVLLGLQQLGPSFGVDIGKPQAPMMGGISPDHAARLNVLEKQVRERLSASATGEALRASAAVEARLARVDELAKQVSAVALVQSKLTADYTAHREAVDKRLGVTGTDLRLPERLVTLEEQIATMANVAATNPQNAGRIPQLAQLTGQIADLKSALDNRLTAQRKDLVQELDARVASSAEAAEAAKAGAQRIDREVATVKTEAARVSQRLDQLKSGSDKLEKTLTVLKDEAASLKSALEGFKTTVAEQMKGAAKPADIALAITPLATKITGLETSVQNVMKAEEGRKSNVERIVLSLELGNLKRAMDRGQKYAAELAEVKKVAGSQVDLGSIEQFQNDGVPPITELARTFRTVASAIIDADAQPAEGSVVDRLLSGAKSVVRIRKTSYNPADTSAEAVVARMEAALKETRLTDVMSEAQKLSDRAAKPAQDWLRKVDARRTVEASLAAIDVALKTSLGAGLAATQKGNKQ